MNTIKMSIEPFREWRMGMGKAYPLKEFIFDEFILFIPDLTNELSLKFEVNYYFENKYIAFDCIEVYRGKKTKNTYFWQFSDDDIWKGYALVPPPNNENEKQKKIARDMSTIVVFYMAYIMYEIKERTRKNVQRPRRFSKEYRCSTVNDRIYLLEDLYIYAKDNCKPIVKHEMLCPCWEVRGHYRHYKNGKTVFIKAYKKGKQKDKAKPKEREYWM